MFNFKKFLRWFVISVPFLATVLLLILVVDRLAVSPQRDSSESRRKKQTRGVTNMDVAKVADFKLTISTNKESYKKGEPVEIEFAVENESTSEKELSYTSSQEFDFWIQSEEGAQVWRWQEGKFFTQILKDLKFRPGEKKTYHISWDQKSSRGIQVVDGRYSVVAQSAATELEGEQVKVSIEIKE